MLKPLQPSEWSIYHAAHLLNRAGFGGSPEEISRFYKLGLEAAVNSLVQGEEDADLFPPPDLAPAESYVERMSKIRASTSEDEKRLIRRSYIRIDNEQLTGLRAWWLNRMRYSLYPLREKMTLFWHGHFATSVEKVHMPLLLWQQNETFRAGALGDFRQLAKDISRDPAMMRYLDTAKSERLKPNENFSRELLELFTLGEGVRYTEKDIQESARAFTGYRVNLNTQQFVFARARFDNTEKEFLGQRGRFEGDDIIDIIAAQPETAEFITRKLWTFFAYENPAKELIRELGEQYQKSGYNTAFLLRKIFKMEEFYSRRALRMQVKGPVQWMVQMAKSFDAPMPSPTLAIEALRQMGQVLFAPPNVKGWDGGRTWISSSTLIYRYNLAGILVGSSIDEKSSPGSKIPLDKIIPAEARTSPEQVCDIAAFRLLNAPLPAKERVRFIEFLQAQSGPLSDSTLRDFLHLMMSTPEYQLT